MTPEDLPMCGCDAVAYKHHRGCRVVVAVQAMLAAVWDESAQKSEEWWRGGDVGQPSPPNPYLGEEN